MGEHRCFFEVFCDIGCVVRCRCGNWIANEALVAAAPEMRSTIGSQIRRDLSCEKRKVAVALDALEQIDHMLARDALARMRAIDEGGDR